VFVAACRNAIQTETEVRAVLRRIGPQITSGSEEMRVERGDQLTNQSSSGREHCRTHSMKPVNPTQGYRGASWPIQLSFCARITNAYLQQVTIVHQLARINSVNDSEYRTRFSWDSPERAARNGFRRRTRVGGSAPNFLWPTDVAYRGFGPAKIARDESASAKFRVDPERLPRSNPWAN
jgi:hypothetical protein